MHPKTSFLTTRHNQSSDIKLASMFRLLDELEARSQLDLYRSGPNERAALAILVTIQRHLSRLVRGKVEATQLHCRAMALQRVYQYKVGNWGSCAWDGANGAARGGLSSLVANVLAWKGFSLHRMHIICQRCMPLKHWIHPHTATILLDTHQNVTRAPHTLAYCR